MAKYILMRDLPNILSGWKDILIKCVEAYKIKKNQSRLFIKCVSALNIKSLAHMTREQKPAILVVDCRTVNYS